MRPRRESPWEPEHRASARHRVAVEAARMLYQREVKEYLHAKREAARRQGSTHLPSNAEVHAQLLLIARKVDGDAHAARLGEMRRVALSVMEVLEAFRPRLIGSVLTGHIRKGSDIDLHLYADDLDEIRRTLFVARLQHEVEVVRTRKGGEPQEFTHVRLPDVDGYEVEMTLYPPEALHVRPRCGITGGPMRRASIAEVRQLLVAEPAPGEGFRLGVPFDRSSLEMQIPELGSCRGVPQNHYHHLDVWAHTWAVVDGVERMVAEGFGRLGRHAERLRAHFERGVTTLLLAAVLHDVGKPATMSLGRDGRIRFHGHDVEGAAMVRAIGQRLGVADVERLVAVVACHLEAVRIPAEGGEPSRIHRLFSRVGDAVPELALLSLADVEAARGPAQTDERIEEHYAFVDFLLEQFFEGGFLANPVVPVTPDDLREELGVTDARTEARLLEALTAAFVDGEFEGREEGLAMAADLLEGPQR